MRRSGAPLLGLGLGLAGGAFLVAVGLHVGCGGGTPSPVCGNGVVEAGESCDEGAMNGAAGVPCDSTCTSISIPHPQVQVTWSLLGNTGVPGYDGSACPSVGAIGVKMVLDGPSHIEETLPCLDYSKTYDADCPGNLADGSVDTCTTKLKAGDYTATVTLLDANGAALTNAIKAGPITANPGPTVNLLIDFEMADFLKTDYTGDFQVLPIWGSAHCADATPPVTKEALFLYPMGKTQPLGTMTDQGNTLDGTPGMCFTPSNRFFYEKALGVPWGPYSLVVKGFDGSVEGYCKKQQVFVGPGEINQAWTVTVDPVVAGGGSDGGSAGGGSCP